MNFSALFSFDATQRNASAAVSRMQTLKTRMPDWMQDWLEVIVPGMQILLIVLFAWLLQYLLRRIVSRARTRYQLPDELTGALKGLIRWVIMASALLLVAFFAAWSVLSNLFCALLIFTVRPYRIGDHIEVLDTAEKAGALGRVVDINLLYTTLEDHSAAHGTAWLQIPNALIFQRVVRRYQGVPPPVPGAAVLPPACATPEEAAIHRAAG